MDPIFTYIYTQNYPNHLGFLKVISMVVTSHVIHAFAFASVSCFTHAFIHRIHKHIADGITGDKNKYASIDEMNR